MTDKNVTKERKAVLKSKKICPVDGVEFSGTFSAMFCTQRCRAAFKRIIERGGKPEFYEQAKAVKNQKIPSLQVKEKKAKTISKPEPQKKDSEVPAATMTKEKITAHNYEIRRQIDEVRKRRNPASGNPRAHQLAKEVEISELESKLIPQ